MKIYLSSDFDPESVLNFKKISRIPRIAKIIRKGSAGKMYRGFAMNDSFAEVIIKACIRVITSAGKIR
jgi:hypothetical protein